MNNYKTVFLEIFQNENITFTPVFICEGESLYRFDFRKQKVFIDIHRCLETFEDQSEFEKHFSSFEIFLSVIAFDILLRIQTALKHQDKTDENLHHDTMYKKAIDECDIEKAVLYLIKKNEFTTQFQSLLELEKETFYFDSETKKLYDLYFSVCSTWVQSSMSNLKEETEQKLFYSKLVRRNIKTIHKMKKRCIKVLLKSNVKTKLAFSLYSKDALGYYNPLGKKIVMMLPQILEAYKICKNTKEQTVQEQNIISDGIVKYDKTPKLEKKSGEIEL